MNVVLNHLFNVILITNSRKNKTSPFDFILFKALTELVSVVHNLEKSGSRDNQFSDAFHLAENTVIRCIHGQIQTEIDNIQKVSNSHHINT